MFITTLETAFNFGSIYKSHIFEISSPFVDFLEEIDHLPFFDFAFVENQKLLKVRLLFGLLIPILCFFVG
jgi:hypothetical protein